MTFADSNVLIDLFTDGQDWADWSQDRLERAASRGPLVINDVVYAEVAARFDTIESLDVELEKLRIGMSPIPRGALFLASKTFARYRRDGGVRTGVLPDFFIGAHVVVANIPLLTRDARRYRHYFPTIELFAPE